MDWGIKRGRGKRRASILPKYIQYQIGMACANSQTSPKNTQPPNCIKTPQSSKKFITLKRSHFVHCKTLKMPRTHTRMTTICAIIVSWSFSGWGRCCQRLHKFDSSLSHLLKGREVSISVVGEMNLYYCQCPLTSLLNSLETLTIADKSNIIITSINVGG